MRQHVGSRKPVSTFIAILHHERLCEALQETARRPPFALGVSHYTDLMAATLLFQLALQFNGRRPSEPGQLGDDWANAEKRGRS